MKQFSKYKLHENYIMWEKQLPNGNFLGLFYPSIGMQNKRTYMVVTHEQPIKGFISICKIDENGSIIQSYKDITSFNGLIEILTSDELQTALAIDQLYAS
jgi:hypothetical protein